MENRQKNVSSESERQQEDQTWGVWSLGKWSIVSTKEVVWEQHQTLQQPSHRQDYTKTYRSQGSSLKTPYQTRPLSWSANLLNDKPKPSSPTYRTSRSFHRCPVDMTLKKCSPRRSLSEGVLQWDLQIPFSPRSAHLPLRGPKSSVPPRLPNAPAHTSTFQMVAV